MPCNDVTEVLSLTLNHEDRVTHYSLMKMTCGGGVGNPSLLRKWIENRQSQEILETTGEAILQAFPTPSTTWEYITLKHLAAVQSGLRALLGIRSAGVDDPCVVDTVEWGPNGVRLIAQIKVEVLTEQIRACGGCSSCATTGPEEH